MEKMKEEKIIGCTIIARNYLAQARILAKSWYQFHKGKFYVLITDEKEKRKEVFISVRLKDLTTINKKEVLDMAFQYDCIEFSTAIKPFFLEHLFKTGCGEAIIFFDPDIIITNSLKEITKEFLKKDILLIPHITKPFNDLFEPTEQNILRTGIFNLGFIGVKNTKNTEHMLRWWQKRLRRYCYDKNELFLDQKWANFMPVFFEKVSIIKHSGCNVAYWNLHEREITYKNNTYYSNDKKLLFFHFSGYHPLIPSNISKHQNRYKINELNKETKSLFEEYRKKLFKERFKQEQKKKYVFDYYTNKKFITKKERELFTQVEKKPFIIGKNSFYRFYHSPLGILQRIYFRTRKILFKTAHYIFNTILPLIASKLFVIKVKEKILQTRTYYKFTKGLFTNEKPFLKGVNILGYFTTESGMGESARSLVKTIMNTNIPFSLNNSENTSSQKKDFELKKFFSKENPYNINIIVINGDRFRNSIRSQRENYLDERYTIAYWVWELESMPEKWKNELPLINEFWVPSTFVKEALKKITHKPIFIVPHSISIKKTNNINIRKILGIPSTSFMFLFVFDFFSYVERKNPEAIMEAFKKAFKKNENVILVIKSINKWFNKKAFHHLQSLAKSHNILFFDAYLEREKVNALIKTCDCYVSLHRSEGFGLTMAEAMAMGKPVIHTNYSGNTDFTTKDNSYGIKYKKVKILKNIGPYKKGNMWAKADINHAAKKMRYVFEHFNEAKRKGEQARKDIIKSYSPKVIGEKIENHIHQLMRKNP